VKVSPVDGDGDKKKTWILGGMLRAIQSGQAMPTPPTTHGR
jgi:hypothetical protein